MYIFAWGICVCGRQRELQKDLGLPECIHWFDPTQVPLLSGILKRLYYLRVTLSQVSFLPPPGYINSCNHTSQAASESGTLVKKLLENFTVKNPLSSTHHSLMSSSFITVFVSQLQRTVILLSSHFPLLNRCCTHTYKVRTVGSTWLLCALTFMVVGGVWDQEKGQKVLRGREQQHLGDKGTKTI